MKRKHDVMLILEGTYPFNGGGVSTWAHMLCNEVKNSNFTLYSINAEFESKSKYKLSENVTNVIQVPLWSPMEPQEMIDYGKKYCPLIDLKIALCIRSIRVLVHTSPRGQRGQKPPLASFCAR